MFDIAILDTVGKLHLQGEVGPVMAFHNDVDLAFAAALTVVGSHRPGSLRVCQYALDDERFEQSAEHRFVLRSKNADRCTADQSRGIEIEQTYGERRIREKMFVRATETAELVACGSPRRERVEKP